MEDSIKKRILFRSKHRGCKEMDILLGDFASNNFDILDDTTLKDYEVLLNEADDDILKWIIGSQKVPTRIIHNQALSKLIEYGAIRLEKK